MFNHVEMMSSDKSQVSGPTQGPNETARGLAIAAIWGLIALQGLIFLVYSGFFGAFEIGFDSIVSEWFPVLESVTYFVLYAVVLCLFWPLRYGPTGAMARKSLGLLVLQQPVGDVLSRILFTSFDINSVLGAETFNRLFTVLRLIGFVPLIALATVATFTVFGKTDYARNDEATHDGKALVATCVGCVAALLVVLGNHYWRSAPAVIVLIIVLAYLGAVLTALLLIERLLRQSSLSVRPHREICIGILLGATLATRLASFAYDLLDTDDYQSSAQAVLSFIATYGLSFATLAVFATMVLSFRKRAAVDQQAQYGETTQLG
jgi:hypothetical protein